MPDTNKPETNEEIKLDVIYSYNVKRMSNGTWEFEGTPKSEEDLTPCIDRLAIARDIIDLGRKLDHQLIIEEAKQTFIAELNEMFKQEENKK